MNEYIYKLMEQYKSANGIKRIDINSIEFMQEFKEWIKRYQLIGEEYFSYVQSLNEDLIQEDSVIEIGKGLHDSLVLDKNISMITPYANGILRSSRLVNAFFSVQDGNPYMIGMRKGNIKREKINTEYVKRFMTHNPYKEQDIDSWDILHNKGDNITVGVFGSINDVDIDKKIGQLRALESKMQDGYLKEYIKYGDTYYYVISSNHLVKRLSR